MRTSTFRMVQAPAAYPAMAACLAGRSFETEKANDLRVEAFLAEFDGDFVNGLHVFHGNDAGFGDVAEKRDLFLQIFGDVANRLRQRRTSGLNTDAEHFLLRSAALALVFSSPAAAM